MFLGLIILILYRNKKSKPSNINIYNFNLFKKIYHLMIKKKNQQI